LGATVWTWVIDGLALSGYAGTLKVRRRGRRVEFQERGEAMNAVDLGVNLFVTLFALLDPIGNLPIFAAATAGATLRQRISVSALICLFAMLFLSFFLFTGLGLLQFFGISLAAFRIAGGILLLFLGLDMARGDFLAMFADKDALSDSKDVRGYARRRFQRLVVPFAIPLMIGPGAISAVIINAGEAAQLGYAGMAGSVVAIAAACVVSCICFALTGYLSRVLGEVGMAIIVKVLGLILCALAIQFILLGLGEAIPGMISGAVTTPYPAAA
jgi:multiple antibiotic resistance protein